MPTTAFDAESLIQMFASASAQQSEQVRNAVREATLSALRGRELTLKNIRDALKAVSQAATSGASQNPAGPLDVEALLEGAFKGMDDALLQAVDANRVALQQFVDQGVNLRETQLKKALDDLEKFEDALIGSVRKTAEAAGAQLAGPWQQVLEKMQVQGTASGAEATNAAEQLGQQMQEAMRSSRAAGLKAVQALAESYSALVSGVLIGMSDALRQRREESGSAGRGV